MDLRIQREIKVVLFIKIIFWFKNILYVNKRIISEVSFPSFQLQNSSITSYLLKKGSHTLQTMPHNNSHRNITHLSNIRVDKCIVLQIKNFITRIVDEAISPHSYIHIHVCTFANAKPYISLVWVPSGCGGRCKPQFAYSYNNRQMCFR